MKKLAIISFCIIFALTLCACKSDKLTQSSYLSYDQAQNLNLGNKTNLDSSSESTPSGKPEKPKNTSSQEPQKVKKSTVIAPYKVVFYKNGKTAESTDAVQNLKIAKHIEAYFEGMTEIGQYNLLVEASVVNNTKATETAVELFFDKPFTFCGGIIHERTRTLLIPLTGEYAKMIIDDDDGNYEDAMGPLVYYPKGLIEFFPKTLNN